MSDTPKTVQSITPSPALLALLTDIKKKSTEKIILVRDIDADDGFVRVEKDEWEGREQGHKLEDKSYAALQDAVELAQEVIDASDNEDVTAEELATLTKRVKALPALTLVPGTFSIVDVDGDSWDIEGDAETATAEVLRLEFEDEDYQNAVSEPIHVEVVGQDITIIIGCQRRSIALWEREGKRIVGEYFSAERDLPRQPHFNRYPSLPRRTDYTTAEAYQQACLDALKAEEKRYATARAEYEKALQDAGPTTRDRMQFALEQVCAALRERFGTPKPTRKRAAKKGAKKAARKTTKKTTKKAARRR